MNIKSLISKLIAQVCEKNYSNASKTLDTIVTEKVKARVKKTAEKKDGKCCKECKKPSKKAAKM